MNRIILDIILFNVHVNVSKSSKYFDSSFTNTKLMILGRLYIQMDSIIMECDSADLSRCIQKLSKKIKTFKNWYYTHNLGSDLVLYCLPQ